MVSVQASRFALLKIDDDVEEDSANADSKLNGQEQNHQSKSKKKNKKKKKIAEENQELRSIAFGGGNTGGGKGKQRTKSGSENHKGANLTSGADWDLWKRQDEEFTTETYEKDLQQALLESKLQFEEEKQVRKEQKDQGIAITESGKQRKKKKATKSAAMTLDQFRQLEPEPPKRDSSDEEATSPPPPVATAHVLHPEPNYFKGASEEVLKILQKEKIQEKYQQQYAEANKMTQKHQEEIDKRDQELEQLRKENKTMKDELKQVKKRNQQLCHILSQGEMKDKTKILMELEELRQVRDELTQEVAQLNVDLEKERSKSRHVQGDSSKSKGAKHK